MLFLASDDELPPAASTAYSLLPTALRRNPQSHDTKRLLFGRIDGAQRLQQFRSAQVWGNSGRVLVHQQFLEARVPSDPLDDERVLAVEHQPVADLQPCNVAVPNADFDGLSPLQNQLQVLVFDPESLGVDRYLL